MTLLDPVAASHRQLATVEGPEELVLIGGNWTYPAFGLSPVLAARDSIIVYGSSERFEAQVMDVRGRVIRTVGLPRSRQPVTDSLQRLYEYDITRRLIEFARSTGRDTLAVIEGGVRQRPVFADSVPAIGTITLDQDLNIWVSEYGLRENPATLWFVFSIAGDLLSEVEVPAGFRIFEVGADWILGVQRDQDGLERVHVHRLVKPAVQH
ncbi:MAG: hypothetical protein ABR551_06725 [Gemmatimonadales bacterium]